MFFGGILAEDEELFAEEDPHPAMPSTAQPTATTSATVRREDQN
jgi:hypothetical protein